jgi:hypothetical protein
MIRFGRPDALHNTFTEGNGRGDLGFLNGQTWGTDTIGHRTTTKPSQK